MISFKQTKDLKITLVKKVEASCNFISFKINHMIKKLKPMLKMGRACL